MMKLKIMALLGALLLILPSCENFVTHDRAGEAVTFGASSDQSGIVTKTSYSGVVSGGRERIDWEDGDQVRIFMYTHDAGNRWSGNGLSFKDYTVVNIRSQGERSIGQLMAITDKLAWEEGRLHDFYSVYPPTFAGYNNQMQELWFWGNVSPISFKLPSSQNGETSGSNMDLLYMAAVSEGYSSEGRGSVELDYYPLVTTLHFTLKNVIPSRETMDISGIKLSSTNNIQLTGTFTASVSGGQFVPSADNIWDGSTEITLGTSATLAYGSSTDFVFFLAPRSSYDAGNLKLTLTVNQKKISIALSNTQVSSFESCKKYNLALNFDGSGEPSIEVSQNALILAAMSDSPVLQRVEYLAWMNPPGMYYKEGYPKVPISDADLTALFNSVTTIVNDNNQLNYLLKNLVPEDFSVFPNLTTIHLSQLGNTETVDVENLNNLLEMAFSGNPRHVTVSHCSFSGSAQPLVLNATSTMDVDINNVSGLSEVRLIAGENGGGNIGNVSIHDCPDLKVIKVYRSNSGAQVAMESGEFNNLPALETIYLDQVNATNSISVSNCDALVRVIVANQTNWLLKTITLANLPLLGDAAADNSEYGVSGLNVDKVSMEIYARKVNCPNLGATFSTHQPSPDPYTPVAIPFH